VTWRTVMRAVSLFAVLALASVASALYSRNSNVISLTKKNFDKEVMQSNHVWLVEFYAPWCGHCKSLVPHWEQAATKLKGIVKVGAVDADQDRDLGGRFGVRGFPTIKAFRPPAGDKKKGKTPLDYNGGRTAKDIVNYAMTLLPTKNVAKLTKAESLETFLKGDLPKAILFTEKTSSPPVFTGLSVELQDRMAFGMVPKNAEDDVKSEFGVSSFPLVMAVTAEGERVTYDGDIKPDKLLAFLKKYAAPGAESSTKEQEPEKEKPATPTPKPTDPPEPAAVYELTSDAVLTTRCVEKKHLCLIAFLDPLTDEASHKTYLDVLLKVAEKNNLHMSVVWVDAAKQPDFFGHFDATDIPSLRLWNKNKGSLANVIAAMTPDGLNKFISDALAGRVRMGKISDPPALVEGGVKFEEIEEEPLEEEPQHQRDEL